VLRVELDLEPCGFATRVWESIAWKHSVWESKHGCKDGNGNLNHAIILKVRINLVIIYLHSWGFHKG
jgi:hypothetical protein